MPLSVDAQIKAKGKEGLKIKGVVRLLLAASFSAGLFFMMTYLLQIALPVAHRIQLTVAVERLDTFQVFHWNGVWVSGFIEKRSARSELITTLNKPTTVMFNLKDVSVERLRIDPGNHPGKVRLYELKIFGHYSKPRVYKAAELHGILEPGTDQVSLHLRDDYLEIYSKTGDPILLTKTRLLDANPVLLYGLPLFFAAILFFKVKREGLIFLSASPSTTSEKMRVGKRMNALDGLRGVAAIMVVGEHSCSYLAGLGTGGVWIFMALSGFLAAKPYIDNSRLALDPVYAGKFLTRRLSRIAPIYYLYIVIIYLCTSKFNDAVRHLFFLQADGHLWFIPQVMLFYLVFPLMMFIFFILFKGRRNLIIFTLFFSIICSNIYLTGDRFSLYGMNHQHYRFFLGTFLSGTLFFYLYHLLHNASTLTDAAQKRIKKICSVIAWIILISFIFFFSEILWGGDRIFTKEFFPWFGFAAGALIFCLAAAGDSLINRLLSFKPLQSVGLVSLSLYLFHPLVIRILSRANLFYRGEELAPVPLYIGTVLVTYLVARFLYLRVEQYRR